MRLTDLLYQIGRPVAYYPSLACVVGGATHAIFLCQLIYWLGKEADPEGWIFKTAGEMEAETGLSRRERDSARRHLRNIGVLEETLRGVPPITHYRINTDRLEELWQAWLSTS